MSVGHNIPREKQWEWQHLQIDQWGWSVYKSRSLKEIIALGKYYFHIRTIETSQFYIVNTVLFRFLQESVFSKQNVFVVNNRKVLMLLVGFFFYPWKEAILSYQVHIVKIFGDVQCAGYNYLLMFAFSQFSLVWLF